MSIRQTIKKSGFENHFIFPGLDCDSDIYYAGADIYALTSREDPFPSVILEALDALTPVVAFTESGGVSELFSRGGGVLVDEINTKAFSTALIRLINNPDKEPISLILNILLISLCDFITIKTCYPPE